MVREAQLGNSAPWKQRFRAFMIASTQIARLAPGSRRYSVIGSSAGLCSPCVILERVRDLIHIVWARQSVAAQAEVDGDQEQNIGGFSKLRFQA